MKNPFLFISYRREDEGPTAIFIKSKLDEVFGSEHVFMDLDNIQRGDNWKDTLKNNLEECNCLIVIISKYKVVWTAAGADMHKMTGNYSFTVK